MVKLRTKSQVYRPSSDKIEMDSVRAAQTGSACTAINLVIEAQRCWDSMDEFRKRRDRCIRYSMGDQWSDIIHVGHKEMTEEEYILSQGQIPLKNNLIRRLTRNIVGVYRSQTKECTCGTRDRNEQMYGDIMSTLLQYNGQRNRLRELSARAMDEFITSGLVVFKKTFCWRRDQLDCWTTFVDNNMFFMDPDFRDPLGSDIHMLGQIHDLSFNELCSQFAHTPEQYKKLSQIYSFARNRSVVINNYEKFGHRRLKNVDFLMPDDPYKCRVIEVWTKESKPRYHVWDTMLGKEYKVDADKISEVYTENAARRKAYKEMGVTDESEMALIIYDDIYKNGTLGFFIDSYWYCRWITPTGVILDELETPYEHKEHPYVFKMYPMLGGEIHSVVEDVIDQQRYVNRLIIMYDWIMKASAKGLLLVPQECLGDNKPEDFADAWSTFNGVLVYESKGHNKVPQQVANNSTNIGITELLSLQMKFMEDISGVNGALQGKPGYSGVSGRLYEQQTQNATMSLLDFLDTFSDFLVEGAYKDVKLIQQYYTPDKIEKIAGASSKYVNIDPEKALELEYDLTIQESTSTPEVRAKANELILEIWKSGQINLEQMLETGDFPFADDLLNSIRAASKQIDLTGQIPEGGGVSPELAQQVQQGANMDAVNRLYGALQQKPILEQRQVIQPRDI